MDSGYQQAMVAQLMGGQNMAPGMTGQNASTPYGAAFMTGNQSMPQYMMPQGQGQMNQQQGNSTQPMQTAAGMLNYPLASVA